MVKQARFSLPIHDTTLREAALGGDVFEDLDELVGDDHLPPGSVRRRKADRNTSTQRKDDRRHLAGSDWLTDSGPAGDD